jgi:CopA family copper-resistance protein
MTYQDVRIPGLRMTVVQADGNNVQPVTVDEFRIAPAETLDVIVQPPADQQYQILGESMGRQGFARMTLATREGLPPLPLPAHRSRPQMTMADMGMSFGATGADRGTPRPETDRVGHVAPMDMGSMNMGGGASTDGQLMAGMDQSPAPTPRITHGSMPGMDHSKMAMPGMTATPGTDHSGMAGMTDGGLATGSMPAGGPPMADPIQQDTGAPAGAKVLSYRDLKALKNPWGNRKPDRVIEVRLTGNMERYFWSINGNKYSEAQPIVFNYGERVRLHFINETMMNHPMHLHGMWMVPDVGNGAQNPLKHVVNVKPGTELNVDVVADAEGSWAFHCHLLYHMDTGMMRKIVVQRASAAL